MQIFYFKIPDNVDIVSVKVTSESEGCAIVSAMNIDISVREWLMLHALMWVS